MDAARDLDDTEMRRVWHRYEADPTLMTQTEEPHLRGAFLVAAVFDAFLKIYEDRIADLKRIATNGTGVLPDGQMHPDLVNRMANEAAKSARHVLRMCIRAMDYVPPVDITFGEFLRALITADFDLIPNDTRRYRVAFIEAFRRWGIYPRDVRTLSDDSLRWQPPKPLANAEANGVGDICLFREQPDMKYPTGEPQKLLTAINSLRRALAAWQPGKPFDAKKSWDASLPEGSTWTTPDTHREKIFNDTHIAQGLLNGYLSAPEPGEDATNRLDKDIAQVILRGIDRDRGFQVTNMRPARRIGVNGEYVTELVVEIIQTKHRAGQNGPPFRGGVTLIIGLEDTYPVRYAIYKDIDSTTREARQEDFALRADGGGKAAEYSSDNLPEESEWKRNRPFDREAMRASSCECRDNEKKGKKGADNLAEPFALLHRQ
jgi:hypothetical protein